MFNFLFFFATKLNCVTQKSKPKNENMFEKNIVSFANGAAPYKKFDYTYKKNFTLEHSDIHFGYIQKELSIWYFFTSEECEKLCETCETVCQLMFWSCFSWQFKSSICIGSCVSSWIHHISSWMNVLLNLSWILEWKNASISELNRSLSSRIFRNCYNEWRTTQLFLFQEPSFSNHYFLAIFILNNSVPYIPWLRSTGTQRCVEHSLTKMVSQSNHQNTYILPLYNYLYVFLRAPQLNLQSIDSSLSDFSISYK